MNAFLRGEREPVLSNSASGKTLLGWALPCACFCLFLRPFPGAIHDVQNPKPKVRIEDPRRMRLASCLRLLPCTAACLRSTAGPVATARPCRPTTLPLRKQHGGAAHTHYLFLTCTRHLCSARQEWRYPSLSPISIFLSQVQGPEPLRPERGGVHSAINPE